jgi:CheY-like chemotaxis protein
MQTCAFPEEAIACIVERPGQRARLRVLLVEDHTDPEQSLAPILRGEGHSVRIAVDGDTALVSAQEEAPDVVLLDLDVPGLDGEQMAQALREQSHSKRPLLIALSGPETEEALLYSLPGGIDLHLVKPLAIESLLNLLWRFRAPGDDCAVIGVAPLRLNLFPSARREGRGFSWRFFSRFPNRRATGQHSPDLALRAGESCPYARSQDS